ncbi:hypothetical protein HB848_12530 [Listeria rocourtiae]|uniref:hypothetical protein n=1 Tax=Listeria rocourtiae TaxID=647910 RepID=UPI0016267B0E|nr:hypothetical protein [Listeria rocourtiae]MBC1436165.1 hypothetical protein [Listeria rocourtiae]
MTSNIEGNFVNETATKFAYEHTWVALTDEMVSEKLRQAEKDFSIGDTSTWEEVRVRVASLTNQVRSKLIAERE